MYAKYRILYEYSIGALLYRRQAEMGHIQDGQNRDWQDLKVHWGFPKCSLATQVLCSVVNKLIGYVNNSL